MRLENFETPCLIIVSVGSSPAPLEGLAAAPLSFVADCVESLIATQLAGDNACEVLQAHIQYYLSS